GTARSRGRALGGRAAALHRAGGGAVQGPGGRERPARTPGGAAAGPARVGFPSQREGGRVRAAPARRPAAPRGLQVVGGEGARGARGGEGTGGARRASEGRRADRGRPGARGRRVAPAVAP